MKIGRAPLSAVLGDNLAFAITIILLVKEQGQLHCISYNIPAYVPLARHFERAKAAEKVCGTKKTALSHMSSLVLLLQ